MPRPTPIQVLAAHARAAKDPTLPPPRTNDEARERPEYLATRRLAAALAAELGAEEIAERIVSMWLITQRPIDWCIAEALKEPVGGWPQSGPAAGLGAMVHPSPYGRQV